MLAELEDRIREDHKACSNRYKSCVHQGLNTLAEYWDGRRKSMTAVLRMIQEVQGVTEP